jgi:hypothetical protein
MIWGEIGFGITAAVAVLAARRPDLFAQNFLADWQRQRFNGNMAGIVWIGWIIFGFSTFTLCAMLMSEALQ